GQRPRRFGCCSNVFAGEPDVMGDRSIVGHAARTGPSPVSLGRQHSTQSSPWRFSGRLTAPPCQRPFAELVARISFGYSGHSLVPTDDRDKIAAERSLQKHATSSSRPEPVNDIFPKPTFRLE
ncbi:MAG TPA: hypothetical protein VFR86_27115, partial [Burkholderiaceae bacterium]|nr:hypothetical protein [Burkholderiaceae bacterium]